SSRWPSTTYRRQTARGQLSRSARQFFFLFLQPPPTSTLFPYTTLFRSLIMFIPSTFKRPVSSWKALNLRKTLLMASSVRLKPLNCSRLPCVYAQETLTFLLTQKKTCVKNYVQKE